MTDLGTLGGTPDPLFLCASSANSVNDLGQIVGWSNTNTCLYGDDSVFHGVLWTTSGAIRDLGTLPGDTLSTASKINHFGQVIGASGNMAVHTLYDAFFDLSWSRVCLAIHSFGLSEQG